MQEEKNAMAEKIAEALNAFTEETSVEVEGIVFTKEVTSDAYGVTVAVRYYNITAGLSI